MVYESPAAGRSVACRKHSPWTMERDRKKSKAHLGSPEPLSEEVEEEEEEDPDDHEMTEQEAQMLACLDQLNFRSSRPSQGSADGTPLSRGSSAADGQRRKLRKSSRWLCASYNIRLHSCSINEKGSPLPHSSRSYATGTGGGHENIAPILFAPVTFGDHSKCWLGRRHSPSIKDTSAHSPKHQGVTGVTQATSFPVHVPVPGTTTADQSLLAAAAHASSSRHDKHLPCDSPAPKGRSHRRSLSGASIPAASGLNDSAEALHGPSSEGCTSGQGPPSLSGAWPHSRGASEGSASHRHVTVTKASGNAGSSSCGPEPLNSCQVCEDGGVRCDRDTRDLPDTSRTLISSSTASMLIPAAPPAPMASVLKYGIAAFGVPASVQSCFADPPATSVQCPTGSSGAGAASASMDHQHEQLARCAMSCPEDMCYATTAAGTLGWHIVHGTHGLGLGSFTGGSLAASEGGASLGSGCFLDLGTEPLANTSSEPVIAGHARHGGVMLLGTATGPLGSKALADSAEELELRRLAQQQQPHVPAWQEMRQGVPHSQIYQPMDLQHPPIHPGAVHSRPASMGSAAAGATAANGIYGAGATSQPLPSALPNHSATFAPLDLARLARFAGAAQGPANDFMRFSASGRFSTDAMQGDVDSKQAPLDLWAAAQRGNGHTLNDRPTSSTALVAKPGVGSASPWLGSCSARDATGSNSVPDNRPLNAVAPDAAFSAVDAAAAATGTGAVNQTSCVDQCLPSCPAVIIGLASAVSGSGPGANTRCVRDGDRRSGGGDGDGDEDGDESWLRTSQQAPDPDDPSSAGKYSAVLLRRLQVAAEHEELLGGAGNGVHSAAYGFYHLQGSCDSHGDCGLRSSGGRVHLGSQDSSSMEPSPLPRMSSRLRRLRVSPCLDGSGVGGGSGGSSGGPLSLSSPAPSHLLGTRSRSTGVTPGAVTCRRLRRRSDLLVPDQLGQGSGGARSRADVDEQEDSDGGAAADEHMYDASHQLTAAGSGDRLHLLAGRRSGDLHRGMVLPLQSRRKSGSGLQLAALAELRSEPMQRLFSPAAGDAALVARARSATGQVLLLPQHRSQPLAGDEDFLSGLMDYEDNGVEYMTPPHTPLRGIGGTQDQDAATAQRAGVEGVTVSAGAPRRPLGASAADEDSAFAMAPGCCPPGIGKGLLQQRVSFAAHRWGGPNSHPSSPPTATCHGGEGSCALLLASQCLETTQEFNRTLALAATKNDRGSAERLWQEMCSRGVPPDADTLNLLLRCLSRSAADPDEAQLLVREVCRRGGFPMNATAQRLLEEICFRFEQLNASTLVA